MTDEYKYDKHRQRADHVHYWVGHKEGYLFCSCGVAKIGGIIYPLEYIRERNKVTTMIVTEEQDKLNNLYDAVQKMKKEVDI